MIRRIVTANYNRLGLLHRIKFLEGHQKHFIRGAVTESNYLKAHLDNPRSLYYKRHHGKPEKYRLIPLSRMRGNSVDLRSFFGG